MNFDMPPSRSVNAIGEKTVLIKTTGNEKNHFAAVLGCLADDTKLKPTVFSSKKLCQKYSIRSSGSHS